MVLSLVVQAPPVPARGLATAACCPGESSIHHAPRQPSLGAPVKGHLVWYVLPPFRDCSSWVWRSQGILSKEDSRLRHRAVARVRPSHAPTRVMVRDRDR